MMLTSRKLYNCLLDTFGPSEGWPGNTVTIMATAVMVQNTAWTAVVRAMERFPHELTAKYLLALSVEELMDYIRPCGFMRRKAETIQTVMAWYGRYGFDAAKVEAATQERLREELLAIKGIGEETADVILLYAFHKPVFVLDAYTRRLLLRLGSTARTDAERRAWFTADVPEIDAEFTLGRFDIFSYGDAALRGGMVKAHGFKTLSKLRFKRYRKKYAPYCSVASLYYYAVNDDDDAWL